MKLREIKRGRNGFTIVELLIVIVIIAVLAAITIVAYNGIQSRARQSANFTGVESYVRSLRLLKAETGSLPVGNGANASCLGPDPQPSATCALGGQNASASSSATATTKSQLAQYGMKSQPSVGVTYGGYLIYTDNYFGQPALMWQVPPDQDCVAAPARFYQGSWVDNVKFSYKSATVNTCYMSLSNL